MLKRLLLTLSITLGLLSTNLSAKAKPELIFYCGITMVKPMKVIASHIEKTQNCTIKIVQGGSADLYSSLKFSKEKYLLNLATGISVYEYPVFSRISKSELL